MSNYPAAINVPKVEICSDEGANVQFNRSATRYYDIPPEGIRRNTVPRAMALIHDYLQPSDRHQPQVDTFFLRINFHETLILIEGKLSGLIHIFL